MKEIFTESSLCFFGITKKFRDMHFFLDISLFVFLTAKMLILISKTKAIRIFINFLPRVSFLEANRAYVNSFTEHLQISLLESWWELHIPSSCCEKS